MKKIFTLLFLLSLGISASQAQKFRFGISGSTGYAWLKPVSKGLTVDKGAPAFSYGLMFDWNLGDNYAIATGLDISYKGGSLAYSKDTITGGTTANLQYIEIPLMLKMKTKAIGYFTYFVQFGGSLGVTLNRSGDYMLNGVNSAASPIAKVSDDKLNDYYNPITTSFIVSLGTEYNISGKTNLYGSLFFNNAFIDVLTDPKVGGKGLEMNARANVAGLKLGIFF